MLALLALVGASAGCAELGDTLGSLRGDAPDVPLPWYDEWHDTVLPQHERAYDVPVDAGARLLNVTLALTMHDGGAGVPTVSPAALRLTVRDPTGAEVGVARADATTPRASVLIDAPGTPGTYRVTVQGVGLSETVDGAPVGAGYALTAEVLYAG